MITKQTFWTQNVPQLSPEVLQAMRDWIMECWECTIDAATSNAPELSDKEVIRLVSRMYDGGLDGFLADN